MYKVMSQFEQMKLVEAGMVSKQRNLQVHLPFVEHGLDKAAVIDILEASGLGLPDLLPLAFYGAGAHFVFTSEKLSGFASRRNTQRVLRGS